MTSHSSVGSVTRSISRSGAARIIVIVVVVFVVMFVVVVVVVVVIVVVVWRDSRIKSIILHRHAQKILTHARARPHTSSHAESAVERADDQHGEPRRRARLARERRV